MTAMGNSEEGRSWKKKENLDQLGVLGRDFSGQGEDQN